MQNNTIGHIDKFIVHYVGNKNNGGGARFSDELTATTNVEEHLIRLLNNFKTEELYHFHFVPTLELNPVYQFITSIFQDVSSFVEQSKNCGRYLYDKSTHPNIKNGELCIAYIKDCQINDEMVDCIALFKSENKETVLKIDSIADGYALTDVTGLNIHKLDKGCLIFNTDKKKGFQVSIIDNTNKSDEARYWRDDFLSVQPKKNEYHQTHNFLGIAKQFVTEKLPEDFEVTKADQIDFLNKSVDYFKKNEIFKKEEFEETVFGDSHVIEAFRTFDQSYRLNNELELPDNFSISPKAVKKQARVFKSVLKLDKNFDIYIHGNKDLIEKGVDKDGRKFYKIYYEEEN
ncbi:nucleoid-associated protein [Elizabethkingia anophelis]|nr:nucleoid-associated protein [Elizabethkingia anophelis]MCT4195657.1 nucleoid-associated protein [Elizabethkingia anophelis]